MGSHGATQCSSPLCQRAQVGHLTCPLRLLAYLFFKLYLTTEAQKCVVRSALVLVVLLQELPDISAGAL